MTKYNIHLIICSVFPIKVFYDTHRFLRNTLLVIVPFDIALILLLCRNLEISQSVQFVFDKLTSKVQRNSSILVSLVDFKREIYHCKLGSLTVSQNLYIDQSLVSPYN